MSIFEHHRFEIWNQVQHPFRHTIADFAYTSNALPGVTNFQSAVDWIIAVLYPIPKAAVATPAALPAGGNTVGDYRVVTDDGDGKSAGYRWEQREGDAVAKWYKIYDMDFGAGSVLQQAMDNAQELFVQKFGNDDLDSSGVAVAGTYAGQVIYGGKTASKNLTLRANAGDGVGANTGYVQSDDLFRVIPAGTVSAPAISNSTGKTGVYFNGETGRFSGNQVNMGGWSGTQGWSFGINGFNSNTVVTVDGSAWLTNASQIGVYVQHSASATATTAISYHSDITTSANAFTLGLRYGFFFNNRAKGAGSTITRDIAFAGNQPTQGGTANVFLTDNTSMSGSFFIHQSGTSASQFGGNVTITAASSGATNFLAVVNTSNTASSHANIQTSVAGGSAGNPYHQFTISGAQDWSHGINNASSDRYEICENSSVGTNARFSISAGGVGLITLGSSGSSAAHVLNGASISANAGATTNFGFFNAQDTASNLYGGGADANTSYVQVNGRTHATRPNWIGFITQTASSYGSTIGNLGTWVIGNAGVEYQDTLFKVFWGNLNTSVHQCGFAIEGTGVGNTSATADLVALRLSYTTGNFSYTTATSNGILVRDVAKGASHTINEHVGVAISNQTMSTATSKTNFLCGAADAAALAPSVSGTYNSFFDGTGTNVFKGPIVTIRTDVASAATITAMSSASSFIRITGSTITAIQGITAGINGQRLVVFNNAGVAVTFANENGGATAANRITTMTGADVATVGNGSAELIYDGGSSRWILLYVTT